MYPSSVGPSKEDASHNFASLLFHTYIHPQWCPLGTWELWLCCSMVHIRTLAWPISAVRGELCAWTRCVASLQLLPTLLIHFLYQRNTGIKMGPSTETERQKAQEEVSTATCQVRVQAGFYWPCASPCQSAITYIT